MSRLLRSLRVRLALVGFVATYSPVLVLLFATAVTNEEVRIDQTTGREIVERTFAVPPPVYATVVALAPVAAALAWWWSGKAIGPIRQAVAVQQQLIEDTSHELRTPLSILTTNADVLLDHPDPDLELYRAGLVRSRAVADRMRDTIDGLLVDARGRARTLDRAPTDLAVLVRAAVDNVAPLAAERGVTLVIEAPDGVRARIDPASVERAVVNLVTNAIEHSPTRSGSGPPPVVTVGVARRHDGTATMAEVSVTDAGPGIPPEAQPDIFRRHWQGGGGRPGGAGLGLAIVRQIAEAHGGTVTVESPVVDGRGSRFRLRLAG